MAITTDTGAKKIAGTDNWRDIFDDHNDTVDAYDSNIASITDGLAIMANGNTHAAIAAGQAVYVRNHSTLADGLYWANTAIATNGTLSTSNLTADASGGLNKLKGDIDSLNSNLSYLDGSTNAISDADNITTTGVYKAINSTAHTPASLHFVIYHMRYSAEESTQLAIATNSGKLYTRVYYDGSWSAWTEK